MSGRSTTRYVLLGALGLLAAVFLALLVLTPIEIRSEAVRNFIETKLADALGGRFSYERLRVSLFPRPCASVLGIAFAKDPNLAVTAAEVTVCPQLLPLLQGELRPGPHPGTRARHPLQRAALARRSRGLRGGDRPAGGPGAQPSA